MQNKQRFDTLRGLAPVAAVQSWLDGEFGIGDEPALIEAIRIDGRVCLPDGKIIDAIYDSMAESMSAQECLERLTGQSG